MRHRLQRMVPTRATGLLAALTLAIALHPVSASAQELRGSATLYGWLPWIDGEVDSTTGGGTATTSISAGDVLDALKFAFMAAGEVHFGRVGFLHDTVYSELGNSGRLSGPFASKIDVDTTMLLAINAIGYQVYAQDGWLLEPFAGARYVDIETGVKIKGGGPVGLAASASVEVDYWEPVIGLRGRMPLTEKLTAGGFVNIGGFGAGSKFTWDVFAGLDYSLNDWLSANAGFRYLSINYEADNSDIKLDTYGPVLGVTLRF